MQSRERLTFYQFMPRANGVEPMKGLGYNLKPHPSPVVNNNYHFLVGGQNKVCTKNSTSILEGGIGGWV